MVPLFKNEKLEWGHVSSCCEITVYTNGKEYLNIATEVSYNSGQSITNGSEHLWRKFLEDYGYKFEDCRFLECYIHNGIPEYSVVHFDDENFRSPSWQSIQIDKYMKEFFSRIQKRNRLDEVEE